MLSQMANIKQFVNGQLSDVIDWQRHAQVDPDRNKSGDAAIVVLATPFNKYELTILSPYIEPPAGAPFQCKSLGTVKFDDLTSEAPFSILGPRQDAIFIQISKRIHERELRDAVAHLTKMLAEATAENADRIRTQLAVVNAKAKKWGIKVNDAIVSNVAADDASELEKVMKGPSQWTPEELAAMPQHLQPSVTSNNIVHSERLHINIEGLYVGCPVIYITNPGEEISGMREIPGHCVKIYPDGVISAFLTPDHSEPLYKDNLHRRGGQEGRYKFNCWDFNPGYQRLMYAVKDLKEAFDVVAESVKDAARSIGGFGNLNKALEASQGLEQRLKDIDEASGKVAATLIERAKEFDARIEALEHWQKSGNTPIEKIQGSRIKGK